MNLTCADMASLGKRLRKPRFSEPTMAPTHGLTPAIVVPGRKTYTWACAAGIYYAEWDSDEMRVPVIRLR